MGAGRRPGDPRASKNVCRARLGHSSAHVPCAWQRGRCCFSDPNSPSPLAECGTAASNPRARSLAELGVFPLFLASLVVPHATVLYWLTNGAFGLGLQAALSQPAVAARLGLPMVTVHARGAAGAAGEPPCVPPCSLDTAASTASDRAQPGAASRFFRRC